MKLSEQQKAMIDDLINWLADMAGDAEDAGNWGTQMLLMKAIGKVEDLEKALEEDH